MSEPTILSATVAIASSYLATGLSAEPAKVIEMVYATLLRCEASAPRILAEAQVVSASAGEAPHPAVPIADMQNGDGIACLVCGHRFQMLKRHLRTEHNLEPAEYLELYHLPRGTSLTAEAYSQVRSDLAVKSGLGRKPKRPRL